MRVVCDYCGQAAEMVGGDAIYPHRTDLSGKTFWRCLPCGAYVGCHPRNKRGTGLGTGVVPLGRLANAELRKEKMAAHAAFDPLWKSKRMSRSKAYRWLAERLNIQARDCHIGMMDVEKCRAVVAVMAAQGDAQSAG